MKNVSRITYHVSGFTLIELLIVMIIMGVLAAIGVTAFMSSQIKGRDALRKGNIKAIGQALELYYNDKGQYPTDNGAGGLKGCWTVGGVSPAACTKNQVWEDANATIYMAQYPDDPVASYNYYYVSTNGKQYQLYAHLENSQDRQIITPSVDTSCGTGVVCNYGISSGNVMP